MTKLVAATHTGLTRIFARFGRVSGRKITPPETRWYEYEMTSRGL
jgi:hypothetical protein